MPRQLLVVAWIALTAGLPAHQVGSVTFGADGTVVAEDGGCGAEQVASFADLPFSARPWYQPLLNALTEDPAQASGAVRQWAEEHPQDRQVLAAIADWIHQDFVLEPRRPHPADELAADASHLEGTFEALSDRRVPSDSDDHSIPRFTWWDRLGSDEWVQYDFPEPRIVSGIEVYWFDDRPRGGRCRIPESWQLLYRSGRQWKPVETEDAYGIERDQYNRLQFIPVETTSLRLAVRLRPNYSSGVLAWNLFPDQPARDGEQEKADFTLAGRARYLINDLADLAGPLKERLAVTNVEPTTVTPHLWAELYLDAALARRATRLEPHRPLLQRIVFVKHFLMGGSHYAYTEGQSDAQNERHFQPGSALCLLELDGLFGSVENLLEDPRGVIRDPDVCYDGQRILFAWKKSLHEDDYHLHELDAVTGERRKLTDGLGFADYEAVYLPDGNIVFNSTRSVQTVDCWWTEVSNLFLADRDGRFMRQVGFDQVHTNFPTVTCDGRVVYTRWDYNDRGQIYPQGLFHMNPDGTAQRALYGNNSYFPTTLIHARSIPGTHRYVAIFTGHHTTQKGWLGIVDPARGREENQGAQLIAPIRRTTPDRIDRYGQSGDQFMYPYPLSEREFLVSFQPDGQGTFGIYYVDEDGRRELLAHDPSIHSNRPVPLRARPRPTPQPSRVDYRQQTAKIFINDVYQGLGLPGIARGSIHAIRVIALEYRAAGVGENRNSGPAGGALVSTPISIQGAWDVKRILGTAPVYEDGSAAFEVPARTPLYFQAVDEHGHKVQTMRSWTTLMPNEVQSCVGCHDHKNTTAPPAAMTRAALAGPRSLDPFYGPPRGFSFIQEVQPILDDNCVVCHHLDAAPPYFSDHQAPRGPWERETADQVVPAFSLRGLQHLDARAQRKWSDSYRALAHRRVANWVNPQSAPPVLPPYATGASTSPLITMLEQGSHFGVQLTREEMDKLALWIDLLVPYVGDYTEAMAPEGLPKYRHFLEKRQRWLTQEAQNIADYIQYREAAEERQIDPIE